ncbi:MAG: hypothetical protein WBY94_27525 [Polyangiaceae bacterium]
MDLVRTSLGAGLVAWAAAAISCSGPVVKAGPAGVGTPMANSGGPARVGVVGSNGRDTGTVGGHLSLGPGVSLTSLQWTITNGGAPYTGTVNIGDAQAVEWVAGGILKGTGYMLTVSGADTEGDPCSGTTMPFTVLAGETVQVVLAVTCVVPVDSGVAAADVTTGSAAVDASVPLITSTFIACPSITSLSLNPAAQVIGTPAQLGVMTKGPHPMITWTVTPAGDGTFSDANAATPTFTCATTAHNPLTISATLVASDSGLCTGQEVTALSAFFDCEPLGAPCGKADAGSSDSGTCGP